MEWVGEQYDGCKHNGQLLKVERQRTQYTLRASKDHPFNTNTHIPAHAERGRWAERESGGGVGSDNERITDGCWERWGHREVKERWNPQARRERREQAISHNTCRPGFVSCTVLHFTRSHSPFVLVFFPIQQRWTHSTEVPLSVWTSTRAHEQDTKVC